MNAFFSGIGTFFRRASAEADGQPVWREEHDHWWQKHGPDEDRDIYADFPGCDALPRKVGGRPLRLLALHGRGSNNDVTAIQLTSLELHKRFRVDCLSGPEPAPAQAHVFTMLSQRGFHAWHDGSEPLEAALEPALRGLLAFIDANGPYDGLYGFSQGASVVTALSAPGVCEALGGERTWSFVVCACGVWSVDVPALLVRLRPPPLAPLATGLVDLPSLHIIGRVDHCRTSSEGLADAYADSHVVYHPGGHELPLTLRKDEVFCQEVERFLQTHVLKGTQRF